MCPYVGNQVQADVGIDDFPAIQCYLARCGNVFLEVGVFLGHFSERLLKYRHVVLDPETDIRVMVKGLVAGFIDVGSL